MAKINASEISEKAKSKLRPKQQMGGSVTKNGKDVSKEIEEQTARKFAKRSTSDGSMVMRKPKVTVKKVSMYGAEGVKGKSTAEEHSYKNKEGGITTQFKKIKHNVK